MEWLLLLFRVLFWIRNHFHIVHEYIRRFSSTALILGLFRSTPIPCFKGMQRKTRVRQSPKYSILHLELEMWSIDERNTRARRGLDFAVCMQSLSHIFALRFFGNMIFATLSRRYLPIWALTRSRMDPYLKWQISLAELKWRSPANKI